MPLKEQIQQDLNGAIKNKEELKSSVLRMLSAAFLNKEKEKIFKISKDKPELSPEDSKKESMLSDEEIMDVISSEAKKRRESISGYEEGGRTEMAEKEKKELEILEKYLPEQLSEEEIKNLAKEAVDKTGASSVKDMGKVMAELMPKVKGRADGGLIGKIVKELLG